jgi:hypothetical protein
MKTLNFILLLFFAANCFANDIDKLQTNEDFKKHRPFLYDNTQLKDSSGRNTFFKVDIDNNGLTDLLIYGYQVLFAVLDNGKNDYAIRYLDRGTFLSNNATLIAIDTSAQPTKIIIQQSEKPKHQTDTLVYRFKNFIEYDSNPSTDFTFEKIHFKTNQCFGTCPVFEIIVNKRQNSNV